MKKTNYKLFLFPLVYESLMLNHDFLHDFLLKIAKFKKATANYDQQIEFGNYFSVS